MTSLKVISIGLHRTGSLSLKVALEQLGLGPCYHGYDYIGHGTEHIEFWRKAIDNGGNVDWNELFGRYQSVTDWPTVYFWDKLVAFYPDAKILLTERDPDDWFDSHVALLEMFAEYQHDHDPPPGAPIIFELLGAMFGDDLFDRAQCVEVFKNHYARVREQVPPDRLLRYRVAGGWDPLCEFLGVARPDEPFPRVNGRATTAGNAALAAGGALPATWQ